VLVERLLSDEASIADLDESAMESRPPAAYHERTVAELNVRAGYATLIVDTGSERLDPVAGGGGRRLSHNPTFLHRCDLHPGRTLSGFRSPRGRRWDELRL